MVDTEIDDIDDIDDDAKEEMKKARYGTNKKTYLST